MTRMARISIPRRLVHVNIFSKNPMQERILNIKLAHAPLTRHSQRKKNTDSRVLNNGTKRIIIIDSFSLFEAFSDKPCFVPINGTICLIFQLKNPFTVDNIQTWARRHQAPGAIAMESSHFFIHGRLPERRLNRVRVTGGLSRNNLVN
jgi:hypothetical protein